MLKFCPIRFGIISGYNSIRMLLVQPRKRTRLFFIIMNTYSNVYELFHFNADLVNGDSLLYVVDPDSDVSTYLLE